MEAIKGLIVGWGVLILLLEILRVPISLYRIRYKPFFLPGWYYSLPFIASTLLLSYWAFILIHKAITESILFAIPAIPYFLFIFLFVVWTFSGLRHQNLLSVDKKSVTPGLISALTINGIEFITQEPADLIKFINFPMSVQEFKLRNCEAIIRLKINPLVDLISIRWISFQDKELKRNIQSVLITELERSIKPVPFWKRFLPFLSNIVRLVFMIVFFFILLLIIEYISQSGTLEY